VNTVATGTARLKAELTGANNPGANPQTWTESGTVQSVVEGYDAGGYGESIDASVVVTWRNADVPVSYVATYTPVVGDVVLLLIQPPKPPIVLGRIVGPSQEA
jgi:hypothetical protein